VDKILEEPEGANWDNVESMSPSKYITLKVPHKNFIKSCHIPDFLHMTKLQRLVAEVDAKQKLLNFYYHTNGEN